MAFGKNSRPGKRPSSSSSSSYLSTATTIGFIALCLLGVWMITSSSIIPAQSTTTSSANIPSRSSTRFSKFVTIDPPPIAAFEEDATFTIEKPSSDLVEKASSGRRSGGSTSDKAEILEDTNTDDNNKNNSSNSDDNSSVDKVEKVEEDQEKEEEEEEKIDNQDKKEENLEPQMQEKEENPEIHTILDSDENQQQLQEQQLNQKEESEESKAQSPEQSEVKNEENQQQFEQQSDKENANGQIKDQSQSQQQQQSEIIEIVEKEDQNQNNDQDQSQQQQQQQQEQEEEKQQNASGNEENQQQQQSDQGGEGETNYQIPQHSDENGPQSQINEESSSITTTTTSVDDRDIDEGSISQKIQQSIEKLTEQTAIESFPDEARTEIAKGDKGRKGWWSTQADQSNNEKERRQESSMYGYSWELCNVTAGPDYIPCLDNEKALRKVRSTRHFQHRERHCPDENPSCLVPIPEGYKRSIEWPNSRDKVNS